MKKLLIALLMVAFGTSAFAMEFSTDKGKLDIYASVRTFLYYESISDRAAAVEDLNQLKLGIQNNSRAGIRWNMGDILAHAEFGFPSTNGTGVDTRLFYGGYKFGGGEDGVLKFGHIEPISNTNGYFNRRFSNDDALNAFGSLAQTRRPGAWYQLGGFGVEMTSLATDSTAVIANLFPGYTFTELVPKIELAYQISFVKVFGAYGLFQFDNGDDTEDLTAYHAGLVLNPKFGENNSMYAVLTGFYSQNGGAYQMVKTGNGNGGTTNLLPGLKANGDVDNVKTYGVAGAFGIKLTETATLEIGAGYQSSTADDYDKDDNNMGGYVNVTFKPVPNIMVTPEVGYYDFEAGGLKDAKTIQGGVQLRLDI